MALPALPGLENVKSKFNIPSTLGNFGSIPNPTSGSTPAFTPQGQSGVITDFPKLAEDIVHGIARSGAAIGLDIANTPELQPPTGTVERMVKDIIYGPDIVKSLSTRIAEGEQTAKSFGIPTQGPLGTNPALALSWLVVGGTAALDFSGVGGEKLLGKKLLAETSPEIISKLLTKLKVSKNLIPTYSKLFAEAKTSEEVSNGLRSLVQDTKIPQISPKIALELPQGFTPAKEFVSGDRVIVKTSEGLKEGIFRTIEEPTVNRGSKLKYEKAFVETTDGKVINMAGKDEPQLVAKYVKPIIPIELQPLAQEAHKFTSAEEFANAKYDTSFPFKAVSKMTGESYGMRVGQKPMREAAIDFYNQAVGKVKGISEISGGKAIQEASQELKPIATQATEKLPLSSQQPLSQLTPELNNKLPLPKPIPSIGEEVKGAIDRLTEAIKTSAKPARIELEKAYQAERAKRTGAVAGIFEQGGGQKGYFQALGKLKGELAPKSFEGLNLVEKDINSLFKAAQLNPHLDIYEKLNTQTALTKILTGTIPTNQELSLLEKTFGTKVVEAILSQRSLGRKILDGLGQIANLPKTIMASFDLSAPFRQGLALISHPKAFGNAFVSMFKQFGSENAFKAVQESITQMPEYELMKQGKLALTDMGQFMTNREEKFMASWAEKIPLLKYPVKASNRAYTGFLNKLRADVFTQIVKGARAGGRELDENLVKQIAQFVNAGSGRGPLGPLERGAVALNGISFSPRLVASRLYFFNPYNYIKADPVVRKELFKSLFTVLGSGMTLLGVAKLAGAKVGDDWRSADFGKIRIGNTRIDIWGGFQQYVRMAGQLITGQYVSTTTGKITTLGEGYKPLTRFDIALRQIESKESPVLSFFTDLLKQQDYTGKPIKITNEIAQRFIPMAIGDLYDIAKDNPELLPVSLLGIFGVGLQTYQPGLKTTLGGLEGTLPTTSGLPGLKTNLPGLPGL